MTEEMIEVLGQEELPEQIEELVRKCSKLVKRSRGDMSGYYDRWDKSLETYNGFLENNEDDYEAIEHGEPERMVTPMSYAQIQTFVAFCYLLYTQNQHIFEYQPTGAEDYQIRDVTNQIIERDLRRNQFVNVLYQLLVDVGRFSIGVVKSAWVQEVGYVDTEVETVVEGPEVDGVDGTEVTSSTVTKQITTFEGNRIVNVNPYNFFPDTRLPLDRFQEGEFCAHDEEYTRNQLERLAAKGEVAGVEHVPSTTRQMVENRGPTRLPSAELVAGGKGGRDVIFMTEVQIEIVPSDYGLSDVSTPRKYVVWMANDSRPVKIEPLGNLHNNFTYDVAQFSPDLQDLVGQGLADVIDNLQATASWMINARVASLRRTIDHYLVCDPAGIDMRTVENRSPVILMKPNASSSGVDRYIKQLQLQDYTKTNLDDAKVMLDLMQLTTGINDNALGQYNSGRRSATEARAVSQGASSRLKVVAGIVWDTCLAPLGRKLMLNARQQLSPETFTAICGQNNAALYPIFASTPEELARSEDFFVFDSTLPSEKGFLAQALQELLAAPPEVLAASGINITELLKEILALRGVRNIERFQQPNGSLTPLPAGPEQVAGPPQFAVQ